MAKKKKQSPTKLSPHLKYYLMGGLVLLVIAGAMVYKAYPQTPAMLVQVTDEQAQDYTAEVRRLLPMLRQPDGSLMGEETAEEKTLPIVPLEVAKRTINTGLVSVMAEHCELDWKENYRAFMYHYRHGQQYTDKQMAFLGVLHGFAMGKLGNNLELSCSDDEKATIKAHFFK